VVRNACPGAITNFILCTELGLVDNVSCPSAGQYAAGLFTKQQRLDVMRNTCHSPLNPQFSSQSSNIHIPCPIAGQYAAGLFTEEQRLDVVRNACPGAGACGGMYTANTMASAIEALGMSLPYSSSVPAEDPLKLVECRRAGRCDTFVRSEIGAAVTCY